MLRSLVDQLSSNRALVSESLSAYEKKNITAFSLETIFAVLTKSVDSTYVVVDALDECPETNSARLELSRRAAKTHKQDEANIPHDLEQGVRYERRLIQHL